MNHQKIHIPGGTALVGTSHAIIVADGESPNRRQKVCEFLIDNVAVSNERFQVFVEATNFKTEAERIGWSYVFIGQLPFKHAKDDALGVANADWWRQVYGSNWKSNMGPGSEDAWQPGHPAVHISHNDALAFAKWSGGRLAVKDLDFCMFAALSLIC